MNKPKTGFNFLHMTIQQHPFRLLWVILLLLLVFSACSNKPQNEETGLSATSWIVSFILVVYILCLKVRCLSTSILFAYQEKNPGLQISDQNL